MRNLNLNIPWSQSLIVQSAMKFPIYYRSVNFKGSDSLKYFDPHLYFKIWLIALLSSNISARFNALPAWF